MPRSGRAATLGRLARMASVKLPDFIADVLSDPASRRALGASALALAAAGMNPQVTSPFVTDVQAAIRAQPGLAALTTLVGVFSAGMLLAGGVAADTYRTRRILTAALLVLALASVVSLVVVSGPIFVPAGWPDPWGPASRFPSRSRPLPRSTPARRGQQPSVSRTPDMAQASSSTDPADDHWARRLRLPRLRGVGGRRDRGGVASRRVPDLPGASRAHAAVAARVAVWAFGVISLAAGLAVVGSGLNPIRLAMIALGITVLALASLLEWRNRSRPVGIEVDLRTVTVVLGAGLFVGLAQAVPRRYCRSSSRWSSAMGRSSRQPRLPRSSWRSSSPGRSPDGYSRGARRAS